MTRNRSRQAETEDINPRRLKRGAVKRVHVDRWAIGRDELAPGVVGDTHLGPRIINETHIHPTLADQLREGETMTCYGSTQDADGALIWDGTISFRVPAGFDAVAFPTSDIPAGFVGYYDVQDLAVELAAATGATVTVDAVAADGTAREVGSWRGPSVWKKASGGFALDVLRAGESIRVTVDEAVTGQFQGNFRLVQQASQASQASRVLSSIATAVRPDGLAYDGSSLWVACAGPNRIYEHSPVTGAALADFAAPTFSGAADVQGMTWDGTHLWMSREHTTLSSSRVVQFDTAGTTISSFVQPAAGTRGVVTGLEHDGTNLWMATQADGQIRKYNTTGTTLLAGPFNSPGASFVQGLHWTGSGFLVTCASDDTVYEVDETFTVLASYEVVPGAQGPSTAGSQDVCVIGGVAYIANSGDDAVYRVRL